MIEISACPVCGGNNFHELFECEDYTVSHKKFHVKQCPTCYMGITTPQPESDQLGNYYKSEEYISHSGKSSGGIGFIYKFARSFALTWKKKLIERYNTKSLALDFGCGTGEFIYTLQQSGWQISAVEPSDNAREKASRLTGVLAADDLLQINEKKFDVITAWHVLEHIPNLNETIQKLKSLLSKNGTIFIAVPNYQSPDSNEYKQYWAGYDVPRHLWHFSKESMSKLLNTHGFKIKEIVPMKLDSYYVSLLSEKYKNNNHLSPYSIIKAAQSGFKSNLRAKSKTNHSSLIYIAQIHEA